MFKIHILFVINL